MISSIVENLGTRLLIIHVLLTCDLFPLCPPPPLFLSFSSVPPLTVEGILKFLPGVAWRTLGEMLIPSGVFAEIRRQHQSDDSRLRAVIECWLQGEGLYEEEPSWRRIIWALDGAKETRAAADNTRHFAEPLPGKSLPHILVHCISPASHQIVFIQTQGMCDHMYMYVRALFPALHLVSAAIVLKLILMQHLYRPGGSKIELVRLSTTACEKFFKFDALRWLFRPFLDPSSGFSVALGRLNSDSVRDVHVTACVEYMVWFEHCVYQI